MKYEKKYVNPVWFLPAVCFLIIAAPFMVIMALVYYAKLMYCIYQDLIRKDEFKHLYLNKIMMSQAFGSKEIRIYQVDEEEEEDKK